MSRSYKKHPVGKENSKGMKRYANKRIRQMPYDKVPSGMKYKRFFLSYDIADYISYASFDEFLSSYKRYHSNEELDIDRDEAFRMWYKYYKSK